MAERDGGALGDIPFLVLAGLAHGVVLAANPGLYRGAALAVQDKLIPVEFVQALPPAPSPEPVLPAVEKAPETKPLAAVPAAKPARRLSTAQLALRRQRAAERRALRVEARRQAELEAQARAEGLRLKAEQERLLREALAAQKARRLAEEKSRRESKRIELERQLAMLSDPEETLSPASADFRDSLSPAPASSRESAASAAEALPEPAVGAESSPAAEGALSDGGVGWSIEGPIGDRRLLVRRLPSCPDWVSERGLDLTVQVKFQVLPDGSVKSGAVLKKTSGFPELDRLAVEALRAWHFEALREGAPRADGWGVVSFRFTMG